jgi:hypothetical protein
VAEVETSGLGPPRDGTGAEPDIEELLVRDVPGLPIGDIRYERIWDGGGNKLAPDASLDQRARFCPLTGNKLARLDWRILRARFCPLTGNKLARKVLRGLRVTLFPVIRRIALRHRPSVGQDGAHIHHLEHTCHTSTRGLRGNALDRRPPRPALPKSPYFPPGWSTKEK